jgi:hypothetical protein
MRPVGRWWRFGLAPTAAVLAACGAMNFHRSNEVVTRLLYPRGGSLDTAAATAAMNARFPAGSAIADLRSLVRSVGGRCDRRLGQMYCEIPTRGTVCVVNEILLSVVTTAADDRIEHIEVRGGMTGC